jgi:hypothetical protein
MACSRDACDPCDAQPDEIEFDGSADDAIETLREQMEARTLASICSQQRSSCGQVVVSTRTMSSIQMVPVVWARLNPKNGLVTEMVGCHSKLTRVQAVVAVMLCEATVVYGVSVPWTRALTMRGWEALTAKLTR